MSENQEQQEENQELQEESQEQDKTQKVRDLWNDGKASGMKAAQLETQKMLLERFGTDSLDDIESKLTGKKQEKNDSVVAAYEQKIADLDKELKSVRTEANQSLINSSLSSEFSQLNPHKLTSVIRDFTAEHSVKVDNGLLIVRGQNDEPILTDNGAADVKTIIKNWAEKDENKIFFKGSVNNHINSAPSQSSSDVSKYSDLDYVKALKLSGQYEKDMRGEKIDQKQVDMMYNNLKVR